MAVYTYKALTKKNQTCTGTLESETFESLGTLLQQQGLFLTVAKIIHLPVPTIPDTTTQGPSPSLPHRMRDRSALGNAEAQVSPTERGMIKSVPLTTLAIFTSEFSIMMRTGLPLAEALRTLARQQRHPGFKNVLNQLHRQVQQGQSLSEAFGSFPIVFDATYLALLRAGEVSGSLSLMLERLAAYIHFQREMRSKIQSSLLYPAIIMLTSIVVILFLVIFILPTFATMFTQLNLALPWPTRMLLAVTHHLRTMWWLYVLLAGAAGVGAGYWMKAPSHANARDRAILRIPLIGHLIRNIVMTRLLRTLGTLVAGGVPILEALALSGQAASNKVFEEIMGRVSKAASEGKGLSTPLINDPIFPEAAANMIANAELTGTLPEVLAHISQYYEEETNTALRDLFTVIEPAFVVILGLMVAFMAVSILLPIFQLDSL